MLLSAKKLKHFVNDSDSKENGNNFDATGWMLPSYDEENKRNKINNDSSILNEAIGTIYYFFYEEINTCNTKHLYNFMPPHAFI